MRGRSLAGPFLGLCLVACGADRPDLYADARPLIEPRVVRFDDALGVPVVSVEINGQGPFNLIFDTGAAMLALDTAVAEQLALPRSRYSDPGFARSIAGHSDVYFRRVERLRAGSLEIGGLDAMVVDLPDDPGPMRIDGLLGLAAFHSWVTTIDYQHKTVTFADGPRLDRDAPGVLRLAQQYGLSVFVEADYEGEPFVVRLDTGAGMALFADGRFLERAGPLRLVPLGALYSPTGVAASRAGRVAGTLVLGPYSFPRPIVIAAHGQAVFLSSGRDWAAMLEPHLTMGTRFLRHFRMVIDQKEGRVALLRVEGSGPIESPPTRIIWLDVPVVRDGDSMLVVEPSPSNPAPVPPEEVRSGLQPGDLIRAVDGVALGEFDADSLSRAGLEHVRISAQRGTEAFETTAPVVTLVP